MPSTEEKNTETPPETKTWQEDLKHVGLVRRLLQGRKWYGADWWFVLISSVMVAVFIFVALFPGLLAPFKFDQIVGTSFLAPGAHPDVPVLVVPNDFKHSKIGLTWPFRRMPPPSRPWGSCRARLPQWL